ncbi:hypothetical protein HMPREF0262_03424, partial [Clostridium sp. ATCC 29733]
MLDRRQFCTMLSSFHQVSCQTAAQGAPVTPRPDRRWFCERK